MANKEIKTYKIERIKQPMDRNKLNKLYEEFKSDDDYLNYHMETIEDVHPRYKITVLNDEEKAPVENSELGQSYSYMEKDHALEFIEDCINNNRVSSKPKAVMQNGFSKKALDKYKELIEREEAECEIVNEFTKPSFEDIMNNIYVNTYNGSTYHIKDNDIPDDLREDVGVIIPGIIDSKEEYFEFVKRLKDRGKNGLGRTIYEKYEDYEEAKELIETYKQALFDKYGGKEEFFYAKDMGGMFGAYEYYPTVKPRFKKTMRNIKMDKGINLNELALVKDMGKRIREEYEEEIDQIEVDGYNYTFYENTPPRFKDLPEDLQMFYKTDKNNINGFTHTDKFLTLEEHANALIASKDPDKQLEGYKILENIKNELLLYEEQYNSNFIDIADEDDLTKASLICQLQYDKLMSEYNNDLSIVDELADIKELKAAYAKYLEYQLVAINGYDMDNPLDKSEVKEQIKYATDYVFSKQFKQDINERSNMNSVAEGLYTNSKNISFGEAREQRSSTRNGDNKITKYLREISDAARKSLQNMNSNADNVNKINGSTMSTSDATGYEFVDKYVDGFALDPTKASEILSYMKNNEQLAKKIYELSSEYDANDMFSERTNIDDFVESAKTTSKPMITKNMINKAIEANKNGRK